MFWFFYCLALILVSILSSVVCIIIFKVKRNKDYDKLNYYKVKKKNRNIIDEIDKFYKDSFKTAELWKNGSLFYRKAELSNRLKSKELKKDLWLCVISPAVLGGCVLKLLDINNLSDMLATINVNIEKKQLTIVLWGIIVILLLRGCLSLYFSSMDTLRDGLYRYELGYINDIIEKHSKNTQ